MKTYIYTNFTDEEIRNPVYVIETIKEMEKLTLEQRVKIIAERMYIEADVKKWLRNKAGTEKQIAEMRTAVSNLEIDVENILMERINDKENRATYDRMLEKRRHRLKILRLKLMS